MGACSTRCSIRSIVYTVYTGDTPFLYTPTYVCIFGNTLSTRPSTVDRSTTPSALTMINKRLQDCCLVYY